MLATFQVASLVETLPLVGFVAEAVDNGLIDFTLCAEMADTPMPEPATSWLAGAALAALGIARRRVDSART